MSGKGFHCDKVGVEKEKPSAMKEKHLQIVSAMFPVMYSVPYLFARAAIVVSPMAYWNDQHRLIAITNPPLSD